MFDISTSWINGLGQVITYALIIGAVLWLLSKWKVGESWHKISFRSAPSVGD